MNGETMMTMPVAPTGMGGGYGGFGGDGWWIILFFLCLWGNGGWGNNGGMNGGVGSEVQRGFDHSATINKLDGISQGICDSTYALNNTITTGFANAELSRCNQQAAFMQQLFNMQMSSQQCCCETQRLIERGFCDLNNANHNNTRDIIDNANGNTRAILDFLTNDKIETLRAENQNLKLAASQANQNAYLTATIDAGNAELLRRIVPTPVPSWQVPNPYAGYGYGACNPCGCAA